MKKIICLTLSMCLSLACFTAVAFGADSKLAEGGFYMKSADTGVKVELKKTDSTSVEYGTSPTVQLKSGKYARVFEGAVKLTLTIGTEENAEYLVIMYAGDGDVPTVENTITYINQYHSGDTFIVYPSDMNDETELTILITSNAEDFVKKKVKLGYMPAEKRLCTFNIGSATGDRAINILDVTMIISHIVETSIIQTGSDTFKAADINQDQSVNILDVTRIISLITEQTTFVNVD